MKLTFSMASLVEMARPCSISGAVKAHTSSVIAQFLNARVPVADKSSDAGVIMLQILWPRKTNPRSFNFAWTALFTSRKKELTARSTFYLCRKGLRVIQPSPAGGTKPRPLPAVLLWLPEPRRGSQTCCSSCEVARQIPEKVKHKLTGWWRRREICWKKRMEPKQSDQQGLCSHHQCFITILCNKHYLACVMRKSKSVYNYLFLSFSTIKRTSLGKNVPTVLHNHWWRTHKNKLLSIFFIYLQITFREQKTTNIQILLHFLFSLSVNLMISLVQCA